MGRGLDRLDRRTALAERGILVMAISRRGRDMPELAKPELVLKERDVLVVCGPEDEVSQMLL